LLDKGRSFRQLEDETAKGVDSDELETCIHF
jgi:hypothetical protein